MYCTRCGKEISEESNICPYCKTLTKNRRFYREPDPNTSEKSKIAGGFIGLFLGSLGLHNFYLGHIKKATVQLCLTILAMLLSLACLVFIFSQFPDLVERFNSGEDIISLITNRSIPVIICYTLSKVINVCVSIWAFIESILIFCGKINDGKGKKLC